jgi:hypothetical protein
VTARCGTPINRPRGDGIAMMVLLKPDAASREFPLNGLGVG